MGKISSWNPLEITHKVCLLLNTGQVGNEEQVLPQWRCWEHPGLRAVQKSSVLQAGEQEKCLKQLEMQERQDGEVVSSLSFWDSGILQLGKLQRDLPREQSSSRALGRMDPCSWEGFPAHPSTSQSSAFPPHPLLHCPPHPGTKPTEGSGCSLMAGSID